MPYGFNDDKSKFDLANMGGSTGTFTPNVSTSVGVSSADVNVWKEGPIACVAGSFVPVTTATTFPATVNIGTIDDIKPSDVAGGCAICTSGNYGARVDIDTNGNVTVQLPFAAAKNKTFIFGITYMIGV